MTRPETFTPIREKPPQGEGTASVAKQYVAEARRRLAEEDKKVDQSTPQAERASGNLQFLEGIVAGMPVADLKGDKIVIAERHRPSVVIAVPSPSFPVIVKGEIFVGPDRQVMYKEDSRYNPRPLNQGSLSSDLLEHDRGLYGIFADMSKDAILVRIEQGIQ